MKNKKIWFLSILLIFVSIVVVSGVYASTLKVNSPYTCENHNQIEICSNDTFIINIEVVESSEEIFSAQLDLDFDSSILDLLSCDEGSFLAGGNGTYLFTKIGNSLCILYPKKIGEGWIDSDQECNSYLGQTGLSWNGNLKCCMIQTILPLPLLGITRLGSEGVGGSGVLAVVDLKAKNIGSSSLDLSEVVLVDPQKQSILVSLQNGRVDVVYWKGDANDDGSVDTKDLILLGKAFRSSEGDPNYNIKVDFNCDGKADTKDLIIMGKNFRKSC